MIGLKIVVIISSISIFANIILFSFISLLHLYKDIDIYPYIPQFMIIRLSIYMENQITIQILMNGKEQLKENIKMKTTAL